eukprot:349759-Chlamydomonas_euryale.AAC.12
MCASREAVIQQQREERVKLPRSAKPKSSNADAATLQLLSAHELLHPVEEKQKSSGSYRKEYRNTLQCPSEAGALNGDVTLRCIT